MKNIPTSGGSYIVWFKLGRKRRITVGRLGEQVFRPGIYAYCGSAFGPGGLRARLSHHLRNSERPHWHIDYLKNCSRIVEAWYSTRPENREHFFAEQLSALPQAEIVLAKFGASDCTCATHLIYLPGASVPDLHLFPEELQILNNA
ncbi:MAG: DUF123 domain-containing protein [Desulfuromonas sp.]|nr:MAG: DUF123 domain-containing protein [Desulfuromonas sp.]